MDSRNEEMTPQNRKQDVGMQTEQTAPEDKTVEGSGRSAPSGKKKKRVTIAAIARRSGFSPTAVSITLADNYDIAISDATRNIIKRCATKLGYFPNRLDRGFFNGRSKLIGVLIVVDSYRPFLECLAGIHAGLAAFDCFPLLMTSNWMDGHSQCDAAAHSNAGELPDLRRLLEYQVDGVILFSFQEDHAIACVRELAGRSIPCVVLGGVNPGTEAVDVVGGDNEQIGWMAAEHLLSVGCSSFAFGMPIPSHPLHAVVHSTFTARLKAAGHVCNDFSLAAENTDDLNNALSRLLQPPAGIFCASDDLAAVVLRAAFTLGWWVPRDLAVVTMGQSVLSRLNALPLTTVDRNSYLAGETAAKLLVQRIEGSLECSRPQRILIPPSFDARASSLSDAAWLLQSKASPPTRPQQRRSPRKTGLT